ncbi:MAG: DNA-3-methyladenine glycosylase [Chloroflexota bacterium]
MEPLPRHFYARPTLAVARDLLGQRLVRLLDGRRLSGRIVEVEAYLGESDQASHARPGRTRRNAAMYGPPGHAYVYSIYGLHHCLNAVTEPQGCPAAVLIRALAPLEGLEVMRRQRPNHPDRELTNGPAKLCQALAVDKNLDGADLCMAGTLWIEADEPIADAQVNTGPRINVRGDERARSAPWRFTIGGHPFVSR